MENKLYFRSAIDSVDEQSRTIKGVAVVFNKWSNDLGGFIERILPDAITKELIESSDIIANCEHDSQNYMMARSREGKGTLKLDLREDGLYFEFEAPTTSKGEELLYHVRAGNIDECSFCFSLAPGKGSEKWYRNDSKQLCRDIVSIGGLYDISLVQRGAYSDTYCYARSLEDVKKQEEELTAKLDSLLQDIEEYKIP